MSFLQPLALLGLGLVVFPIIIHLLNLLRHRRLNWAAMRFLIQAKKRTSRFSKLRHWLALLCRALALACMTISLARPIYEGDQAWLSFSTSVPPTIVCVLDRSASMERRFDNSKLSIRQEAIRRILSHARENKDQRVIVFETTGSPPLFLNDKIKLESIEEFWRATDTAANLPGTLAKVFRWLDEESIERAQVIVYSDMQENTFELNKNRMIMEGIGRIMEQRKGAWKMSFRHLQPSANPNRALFIQQIEDSSYSEPAVLLQKNSTVEEVISVKIETSANSHHQDLKTSSTKTLFPLSDFSQAVGAADWVRLTLPNDACLSDNSLYLTKESPASVSCLVACEERSIGETLSAAAISENENAPPITDFNSLDHSSLNQFELLLLQGPESLLSNATIQDFVFKGGFLLKLPGVEKKNLPEGQILPDENFFKISHWNQNQGILANASSGQSLPFAFLKDRKREIPMKG